MLGGLLYDAGNLVAYNIHGNERDFAPLTAALAAAMGGLSRSTAQTISEVGWWIHCVTILVFLNLLPLSKHFHIITALPNVFFSKLPPRRASSGPLAITHVPAAGVSAALAAAEGPGRSRVAHRSELEAGARLVHLHRVRPLQRGVPRRGERLPARAATADPRPP